MYNKATISMDEWNDTVTKATQYKDCMVGKSHDLSVLFTEIVRWIPIRFSIRAKTLKHCFSSRLYCFVETETLFGCELETLFNNIIQFILSCVNLNTPEIRLMRISNNYESNGSRTKTIVFPNPLKLPENI